MSIHTKYIGERSNIVLQTRTFVLPPTYVDNHSYALVEVEKRGAAKEGDCLPSAKSFSVGSQLEETGNTSEKKLSDGHTENHIPKKNIEDDLQSTTFLHQVLTEKHEFISKKKIGCEKESSTASNTNVTNLNKKFGPAQIVDTVRMQLFDVNRDCT
ncbi:hypothetical protein TNCV_2860611 [Trichonephila clavipes]|nr:hypothetical protein TNCV_2860611 [Trichonephila clavipes]